MTFVKRASVLALAAAGLMLPAAGVLADQIDGHWCFTDGRTLSIDGAKIVTPGGNRIEGNYTRHAFSYTVPHGEGAAATTKT